MFRFDLFTVKSLALLMSVLLLALSLSSAMPTLMQTGMATSSLISKTLEQPDQINQIAIHASMDHASMERTTDTGCVTSGACCMDSCGQIGLIGAVFTHALPVAHFPTLLPRNKASRSLGAIYRPPRLTA